jgi:arsenate reductase-like glutaredoxin family protein
MDKNEIKCPDCEKIVNKNNKLCPHCNRNLKSSFLKKSLKVLAILFLIGFVGQLIGTSSSEDASDQLKHTVKKFCDDPNQTIGDKDQLKSFSSLIGIAVLKALSNNMDLLSRASSKLTESELKEFQKLNMNTLYGPFAKLDGKGLINYGNDPMKRDELEKRMSSDLKNSVEQFLKTKGKTL